MLAAVLVVLQLPLALTVLYLDVLTLAAFIPRRRRATALPLFRFAILVPAHNEERLLPRLLASLSELDYPRARYDIHVVADHCIDRTALAAQNGGAIVHERRASDLLGKGYALRWLLERIRQATIQYDAYVILDADSVVSPNLLTVMNSSLATGAQVVQAYYGVLNQNASWSSAIRYAALALFNHLRPRGRARLGLSAGLRGNGMCFASPVLDRFGWEAFALAEDAEFHLRLVGEGVKVTYADEASVLAEMPTSLRQAHTQNLRWERGRLQLLRDFGPRLIAVGVRRRDIAQLDAIAEQLVPPLSVLIGAAVAFCCLTAGFARPGPRRLSWTVLAGQVGYVGAGLLLVRARPRVYFALLGAPAYVLWKLWIYAVAATHLSDTRWVRTARTPEEI